MLLLGIDTSGKTASAALFDSDRELFLAQSTVYTQKTHSQVIMPMVKDIMAQSGKELVSRKVRRVSPGEMEHLNLKSSALTDADLEVALTAE